MATTMRTASFFSLQTFLRGLLVVALVYATLAGWIWFQATKSPPVLHLASSTISVTALPSAPPLAIAAIPDGTKPAPVASASAPAQIPASQVSLTAAPLPGLYESSDAGRLPIIRKTDGMTPFMAYRRSFDRRAVRAPIISIVVADLGLSGAATQTALSALPAAVSFDISPYANAPDGLVNLARAKGHEVWMTLPLESGDYPRVDTGADTLLIGATPRQNQDKLARVLGRTVGYAGVMTTLEPAFLKSEGDMQPVVTALYDRGLGFVDNSAQPEPKVQTMALPRNAPYASIDVLLDASAAPDDIQAALAQLEQKARTHGGATGLIHPFPASVQAVARWTDGLAARGFVLAPLSAQTGL